MCQGPGKRQSVQAEMGLALPVSSSYKRVKVNIVSVSIFKEIGAGEKLILRCFQN